MSSVEINGSGNVQKVVNIIVKVSCDNEKYKVILRLINKILINIGKTEIDDLTKFVDIDREDIIKDVNKEALIGMESELFPLFNKKKVGYYRKTDALVLNCLRGMVKDIGYELFNVHKDITTTFDGKNYRKTHVIYSIK